MPTLFALDTWVRLTLPWPLSHPLVPASQGLRTCASRSSCSPRSPCLLKIPATVSFSLFYLSPHQEGVSNLVPLPSSEGWTPSEPRSLSQQQQQGDINEAPGREVADGNRAKPRRPREALQKDSFWRKEEISWASPKKTSKENGEIFPLKGSKSRWKEGLY